MIACSWLTSVSIWILVLALLITTAHLAWTDKNARRLSRRIHHLEMEQEFPGYWHREQARIEKDRWA